MLGLKLFGVAASAKKHVLNSCSHGGMRKEACRYMGKGWGKRGVISQVIHNQMYQTAQPRVNVYWDPENCDVPQLRKVTNEIGLRLEDDKDAVFQRIL
ncbi:hypothetical protein KI387_001679, partial [Taxus chinensis]